MKFELEEPDEIVCTVDGEEYIDTNLAAAVLLAEGKLFVNNRETVFDGKPAGTTTVLYMLCNDVFYWASADGETITNNEIGELYKMTRHGQYGDVRWICIKRNLKPQGPLERMIRNAGEWDDVFRALPDNPTTLKNADTPTAASDAPLAS